MQFSKEAGLGSVEFITLESKQAVIIWQIKILLYTHCLHLFNQFHTLFNKTSAKSSKTGETWETLTKSSAQ